MGNYVLRYRRYVSESQHVAHLQTVVPLSGFLLVLGHAFDKHYRLDLDLLYLVLTDVDAVFAFFHRVGYNKTHFVTENVACTVVFGGYQRHYQRKHRNRQKQVQHYVENDIQGLARLGRLSRSGSVFGRLFVLFG